MTLRSQRSIYGHCLGHGSGSWMFKAARENCTISYEVNEAHVIKRYTTASRFT